MNHNELGFVFIKENCIQCHACEVACKMWRNLEIGIKWRRVINLWQGEYPNVTCGTTSIACLHCIEPACMGVCPTEAIHKRPTDGIVLVDPKKCIGCQACLETCPYGVPQFGKDGCMQKCDMCHGESSILPFAPPCVSTCPTHALLLREMTVSQKKESEESILNSLLP